MTKGNKRKDLDLNYDRHPAEAFRGPIDGATDRGIAAPYRQRIRVEELNKPGLRRVLEAMKLVRKEAPGFLENAAFASTRTSRHDGGGGQVPL